MTFPGGSNQSEVLEITHSLGTTPTAVVGTCQGNLSYPEVTALGSSKFSIRIMNPFGQPPKGAQATLYWVAVG